MVPLGYERFIITSNYMPSDLWPLDPVLVEAITRRFRFIHMPATPFTKKVKINEIQTTKDIIPEDVDIYGPQGGFAPRAAVGPPPTKGLRPLDPHEGLRPLDPH